MLLSHTRRCAAATFKSSFERSTSSATMLLLPRNSFSTITASNDILRDAIVHRIGEPFGERKYLLLPPGLNPKQDDKQVIHENKIATLHGHQSILFGAMIHKPDISLVEGCSPLIKEAKLDAGRNGDQVQAMATLNGLCDWVCDCIDKKENEGGSAVLEKLLKDHEESGDVVYEACKAIATGKPRPGHSVLGQGTFRDAQPGWEALAMEYAKKGSTSEVDLYTTNGASVVSVSHLADTRQEYIGEAGGAMVRLFFL